jgi:C-terminal processing protease CtpA/Prc
MTAPHDPATTATLVTTLATTLATAYVFPDCGQAMADALRAGLAEGRYPATPGLDLCTALTEQLQAISHDRHLRVWWSDMPFPAHQPEELDAAAQRAYQEQMRRHNYGFQRIERLAGNIGYLELRAFCDAALGGATACAAMTVLAETESLIIDLRRNGGGDPNMVALLITYLMPGERVHLNTMHWRVPERAEQYWTLPYVPGPRYGTKPVYVLTSSRTFSAAEEYTYNLKHLKRATIIGETTGGGAHPGGVVQLSPHCEVFIPGGRSVNPVSGTNWEGDGIAPDQVVPAETALAVAHVQALRQVLASLEGHSDRPATELRDEARAALDALVAETASA